MSLYFSESRVQSVGVVRNVHLLLPHQLPVVPVDGPVVHVELVRGPHAVGSGARVVVGDVGGAADPALAGVVEPGAAVLFHLVEGLVDQKNAASQAGRAQSPPA